MKSLFMKSLASCSMMLLACLVIFSPALVQGAEIFTETLAYETQGLDLDSGTVIGAALPGAEEADIRFAYNALQSPSAVLVPGAIEGIELAYLWDVAFDGVTAESMDGLSFSPEVIDMPLAAGDTILVRTESGSVFKIGNALVLDTGVTFDFSKL